MQLEQWKLVDPAREVLLVFVLLLCAGQLVRVFLAAVSREPEVRCPAVAREVAALALSIVVLAFLEASFLERIVRRPEDDLLLVIVATALVARCADGLVRDVSRVSRAVTLLSFKEAIDRVPEGLLVITPKGHVLVTNTAMEELLSAAGVRHSLVDAATICERLHDGVSSGTIPGRLIGGDVGVVLPDERASLVSERPMELRPHRGPRVLHCTCVSAIDVTDEARLTRELEAMNEQLERADAQLTDELSRVGAVVRNDEVLRMRSRVHDVIGQRLSILHRFLEDGDLSDEAVDRVLPLLSTMGTDLGTDFTDGATRMGDVVSAFALIGVDVHVVGTLPADKTAAATFARVLREAATNAVRHARATSVVALVDESPEGWRMSVINDGEAPRPPIEEHTGLAGMRRTLAEVGASLEVETIPAFRLTVRMPRRQP